MKFQPTLHKLSNGVTIILDPMDAGSVAMGIYIKGGSSIEKEYEFGITHFLEHIVLCGTKKYATQKIISDYLNDNGGYKGGSTSPSGTKYDGRILAENFHVLIDVLSEVVLNPIIADESIVAERGVIIQEINRSLDNPWRQFNGLIKRNIFANSYSERYDNLGSVETISTFTREKLLNFRAEKYTANNIVISITGKIENDAAVISELDALFGGIKSAPEYKLEKPVINPTIIYDTKDDKKQTRLFIGFEESYPDEQKYNYEIMCVQTFASALARRLMQELIDKQGLAYDFGLDGYGDIRAGVEGFETALSPERLGDMIGGIARGCADMLYKNPITQDEIKRRNTMKKLELADFMESPFRRHDRLIDYFADYGDVYDPNYFANLRKRLTPDDVMKYSANIFSKPLNIIAQGPKCDIDMEKIWKDNYVA